MSHDAFISSPGRVIARRSAMAAVLLMLALAGCPPTSDSVPQATTSGDDSATVGEQERVDGEVFGTEAVDTLSLRNWGQWRGPLATGVAPMADPPVHWSETSNVRWKVELPGLGHSTPVVWEDRIYLTAAIPYGDALPPRFSDAPGAHDNAPVTHNIEFVVMAVDRRDGDTGDLTLSDHVVWKRVRGSPYVPSPLLYGDILYYLNHYQNVLTRVHGPSGEDRPGALRLNGIRNIYASPVAAAGRIYITDLNGSTLVLKDGDQPEVLAISVLDDAFSASAALTGRELFLRGERWLYCITNE